jgi:hypothetical protein
VYAGSISVISPVIGLPASILFDTTSYTDTTRKVLAIQNTGNDTLLISGINSTESSFTNETALPVRIPPSSTRNFTIRFTNPINGLHTGNLIISHNDSLRNPGTVAVSGVIYRPTRLRVTSSDFNSRDTSYLPFNITNKLPIVAFQFDVTLPSQFSYIPNSAILTSRANGHLVSTSTLGNGDIRVIAYSMNQNTFYGDSGDVVKLKLAVNADTGVYNVTVKNVIISDSNNTNIATGFDNGFIRVSPYPPTLISPLNGSVGNPVNISLYWSKSLFASNYHLQVATDSLFTNKIVNDSTRTDTTYSLTNLNILQNYYWRVRVKNYSGMYRFSNAWKFRTVGYPTQVVLSSPSNNSINQSLNPTFKWFKAIDQTLSPLTVSNYWFELATDSLFTNIITRDSTVSDTTKSVTGLSSITNYFWRVKAKNQIGWALFSPIWKFTTLPPLPQAPLLISPLNNSTGNPVNLNIIWSKPQYATGYNVILSTDASFTNIVLNDSILTDSLRALTNLNPLTTYYWKVRANNITGWGLFSSVFNFRTVGSPTQVLLSLPSDGAINQPTSLMFKWFKAVDQTFRIQNSESRIQNERKDKRKENLVDFPFAVSNYWFELATDAGFTSIVVRDSSLTDTVKTVSGLNNTTTYYWRVKAKNQVGWAAFSSVWNFTTIVPVPGVPTLLSPVYGSTGNPLNLNLVWSKPANSINFHVMIATDTGFTSIVLNDSTLTDSVKVLTNLTPLTTYYWKVRAKSLSGWSGFASAFNFKTIGSASQVVLNSPVNNSTGQPVNITFNWFKAVDQTYSVKSLELRVKSEEQRKNGQRTKNNYDSPLAVSNYWFELSTDSTFITNVIRDSLLADTTKIISGLGNLTKYYWRVKAKNQINWGTYSSVWNFTTIVAVPSAPTLLIPANGSTGISLTTDLTWSTAGGAVTYRVQVSSDSTFTTTQWDTTGVGILTVSVPAGKLSNLTKYYWRVNATNAGGTGGWSAIWNFTTIVAVPIAPTLLTPANGSTGILLTPTCTWNSVINAVTYRYQISSDSTFATVTWDTAGLGSPIIIIPAGKLSQLTKYYWRVNATNAGGTGPWSVKYNFTTMSLSLSLNLKVYLEGFWDGSTQISDTVMVYLANATTPYAYADSAKVILSGTGTASMNFNRVTAGSYYIVVNHRNHLETWSALPQSFVGGTPLSYDFTTAVTQAYGDNMKQVGSVWVLFGGDANRDGSIDATDIGIFMGQFGNLGYYSGDFNGDESVDASDVIIILQNFGLIKITPGVVPLSPETLKNRKIKRK